MNKRKRRGIILTIENEQRKNKIIVVVEDELRGSARRSRGSRAKEQHNARTRPKVEEQCNAKRPKIDLKNVKRPRIEEQRNARRLKAKEQHKKVKNRGAMQCKEGQELMSNTRRPRIEEQCNARRPKVEEQHKKAKNKKTTQCKRAKS
jgi:hypothetical protein